MASGPWQANTSLRGCLTFKKSADKDVVKANTHHSVEASQEGMAYVACTGLACMRLVAPEEAYQASCAEEERQGVNAQHPYQK